MNVTSLLVFISFHSVTSGYTWQWTRGVCKRFCQKLLLLLSLWSVLVWCFQWASTGDQCESCPWGVLTCYMIVYIHDPKHYSRKVLRTKVFMVCYECSNNFVGRLPFVYLWSQVLHLFIEYLIEMNTWYIKTYTYFMPVMASVPVTTWLQQPIHF